MEREFPKLALDDEVLMMVTIISKNGGNLIVNVKDSRIALDKTLANRIMI